jgi:hypothetical protein
MNTSKKTAEMKDIKAILSTLWIFATLNYLYCDVLGFFDPATLQALITGNAGNIQITSEFLLGAAILMEIPIAMVLLSRVLKYGANRWANIIAGAIMTIVQISSLFFGMAPTNFYIFFSVIEVACTAFIIWYAWTWNDQTA